MKPLSLSDRQLRLVRSAAAAVPLPLRDKFLTDVARLLACEPSDASLSQAVNVTLDKLPTMFFNDSVPTKKGPTA